MIPAYDLLNLRFGFRTEDGLFDIQLWGRNVTDESYFLSRAAANTGAITGTLGNPPVRAACAKAGKPNSSAGSVRSTSSNHYIMPNIPETC